MSKHGGMEYYPRKGVKEHQNTFTKQIVSATEAQITMPMENALTKNEPDANENTNGEPDIAEDVKNCNVHLQTHICKYTQLQSPTYTLPF